MARTQFMIAGLIVGALSMSAEATLLGVSLPPFPDLGSGFINVNYNATTDLFTAVGTALTFNDNGIPPNVSITGGSFNLSATVNGSGVASTGTITVGGTAGAFGSPLLTGNLVSMGWDGTVDIFDFIFTVTGGSLATTYYGGVNGTFGVILSAGSSTFTGNWGVNFANSPSAGVADLAPIPAPGSLAIFLAAFAGGRRRRQMN